jgi:hypothetical protein
MVNEPSVCIKCGKIFDYIRVTGFTTTMCQRFSVFMYGLILKYTGCLQNTVYQNRLHNKSLHFNCPTFLHLFIVHMDCHFGFVQCYSNVNPS